MHKAFFFGKQSEKLRQKFAFWEIFNRNSIYLKNRWVIQLHLTNFCITACRRRHKIFISIEFYQKKIILRCYALIFYTIWNENFYFIKNFNSKILF
jgi:hypothetical protein